MKKPEANSDRDEEVIELFMANGEKVKAKRWKIERALAEVAKDRLVQTIRVETGLVRYAERINEEEKKKESVK